MLLSPGEEPVSRLDRGGTFFELRSVAHLAPIVTLMEISYRTHRTAALLRDPPSRARNCRYRRCQSAHPSLVEGGPGARLGGLVEAVADECAFQPGGRADGLDALLPRCPQRSDHTSDMLAIV